MAKSPECHKCEFRGEVPGSCHLRCDHPEVKEALKDVDPMVEALAIFASVGRVPGFNILTDKLGIKTNPHGVANGWCNWPLNFDPVWLENCNGFSASV